MGVAVVNGATDTFNISATYGAVTVTGSATLICSNGSSNLSGRKILTIYNNSSTNATLYWGYDNSVTTSTGTLLAAGQSISISVGDAISVYAIAASGSHNVRVTEGA